MGGGGICRWDLGCFPFPTPLFDALVPPSSPCRSGLEEMHMHRVAYLARALRLRVNVLLIDADIFVFQDPYRWGGRGGGQEGRGGRGTGLGGGEVGSVPSTLIFDPSLSTGMGKGGVGGRSSRALSRLPPVRSPLSQQPLDGALSWLLSLCAPPPHPCTYPPPRPPWRPT